MEQTIKPLSKAQSKQLINQLFWAIPDIWNGFYLMRDDLFSLNKIAEKKHRGGRAQSYKGLSINDAAKYFVVQHLFEACKAVDGETTLYTIQHLLHIRFECLKAQAYVMENTGKFAEWKKTVQNSRFNELNYSEMVK